MSSQLERSDILRLIPQQGAMCLLEAILGWDAQHLRARGIDPGSDSHPLRSAGRLGSVAALEYAAQAAAAHGGLLGAFAGARQTPAAALLVSARAVQLHALRLDESAPPLIVEVRRQHAAGGAALYEFELLAGAPLARGRLGLLIP